MVFVTQFDSGFSKLSTTLIFVGFHHSQYGHYLFIKTYESSFTSLAIYAATLFSQENPFKISTLSNIFPHSSFHIKDLGDLKYFLGLEVHHTNKRIRLCHYKCPPAYRWITTRLLYKCPPTLVLSLKNWANSCNILQLMVFLFFSSTQPFNLKPSVI